MQVKIGWKEGFVKTPFWLDNFGDRVHGEWYASLKYSDYVSVGIVSCPFLPHVILCATKVIVYVHAIFSAYMASWSITFQKKLFIRYCQSLVDKLTFSDWVSWFLTEMCSDRALSFLQNVRKQGRDRYVFSNHFAVLIHSDSFFVYAY